MNNHGGELKGEHYAQGGVSWIFGRRSVGRILDANAKAPGAKGGGSGRGKGFGGGRRSLSKGNIAKLDRVSKGSPQVMVKVVSRTKTAAQLKRHVDYISRNGELELESDFGPLRDQELVSDVRDSWVAHIEAHDAQQKSARSMSSISTNLMLSMPEGTDRAQFKEAVRDFVEAEFKGQHETLMAFHDDTDKPHAHIAVLSRDDRGIALDADRDKLDRWREQFAARLRDRGIEADATPRHARGIYYKGLHKHDYHRSKAGELSRNGFNRLANVYSQLRQRKTPEPKPWDRAIEAKSAAVKSAYGEAAQELKQSSDPKERAIGERLEAFTQSMKPPKTRKDLVREFVVKNVKVAEQAIRQHGKQHRDIYDRTLRPVLNREAAAKERDNAGIEKGGTSIEAGSRNISNDKNDTRGAER